MSQRICFALDLVNDAAAIAAYDAYHVPGAVWPEIVADLRAHAFEDMEIWRTGNRLVMVTTMRDAAPDPRDPATAAVVERWEAAMAVYQKRLPHAATGEKWVPMTRIFRLEDQP